MTRKACIAVEPRIERSEVTLPTLVGWQREGPEPAHWRPGHQCRRTLGCAGFPLCGRVSIRSQARYSTGGRRCTALTKPPRTRGSGSYSWSRYARELATRPVCGDVYGTCHILLREAEKRSVVSIRSQARYSTGGVAVLRTAPASAEASRKARESASHRRGGDARHLLQHCEPERTGVARWSRYARKLATRPAG